MIPNGHPSFFERWKMNARWPIVWLTYKRRISTDVEYTFSQQRDQTQTLLDDKYIEELSKAIIRIEDRIFKLFSLQFAITGFFVIGFLSDAPSISLFGVALSGVPGLKEVLLALWFTVGLLVTTLISSRDVLICLGNAIQEQRADKLLQPFLKLKIPAPFGFYFYITRAHENWIFSTAATKLVAILIFVLVGLGYFIILFCSLALAAYLLHDIYTHPSLGTWSYAIFAYSCLISGASVLILIRVTAPLPYRDKSELKRLRDLEHINPAAAAQLRDKLFGGG